MKFYDFSTFWQVLATLSGYTCMDSYRVAGDGNLLITTSNNRLKLRRRDAEEFRYVTIGDVAEIQQIVTLYNSTGTLFSEPQYEAKKAKTAANIEKQRALSHNMQKQSGSSSACESDRMDPERVTFPAVRDFIAGLTPDEENFGELIKLLEVRGLSYDIIHGEAGEITQIDVIYCTGRKAASLYASQDVKDRVVISYGANGGKVNKSVSPEVAVGLAHRRVSNNFFRFHADEAECELPCNYPYFD